MQRRLPSPRVLRALLLALDGGGLLTCLYAVHSFRFGGWGMPNQAFFLVLLAFALINAFCLYLFDLYAIDSTLPLWLKPLQTLFAACVGGCAIVLSFYAVGIVEFSGFAGRGVLIGSQAAFAIWAAGLRFCFARWLRRVGAETKWLVIGSATSINAFLRDVSRSGTPGAFTLVGPHRGMQVPELKAASAVYAGDCKELVRLADEAWSGAIIAGGPALPDECLEALIAIRRKGVKVFGLPDFYEQTWYKVPSFTLERSWFAMARGFSLLHNPTGLRAKRVFDILGATVLLMVTLPVVALAAIAIKLESPGPVLFKQVRVGEDETRFTVYKLRSMRNDAEKNGAQWSSENDARVTRVGSLIRKFRIDELPQLFNVILGSMSFIGPRPERPEFTTMLDDAIPFYSMRHMLKPGVTGWAQVMYPYGSSVEDAREKLQYDLYYIKNYSLILDAAIVIKTIRVVLFGHGR